MDLKFYLILIILVISSIEDLKYREVSNLASLFILIISLININIANIIALIIVPLPLIITNIYHKNSFGGADIKILGTLGLYTGAIKGLIILILAETFISIIRLITKKQSQPMIPYILISFIIINVITKGEV